MAVLTPLLTVALLRDQGHLRRGAPDRLQPHARRRDARHRHLLPAVRGQLRRELRHDDPHARRDGERRRRTADLLRRDHHRRNLAGAAGLPAAAQARLDRAHQVRGDGLRRAQARAHPRPRRHAHGAGRRREHPRPRGVHASDACRLEQVHLVQHTDQDALRSRAAQRHGRYTNSP